MQRHEILAWLGDDQGGLDDGQLEQFTAAADDIETRYPDPDDRDEAEAALIAAHQFLTEDPAAVIGELAQARLQAEIARTRALAGLRQGARQLIGRGYTEAGYARAAHVDRMAVRAWLGK